MTSKQNKKLYKLSRKIEKLGTQILGKEVELQIIIKEKK